MRTKGRSAGFTLVEVMVALLIVALTAVLLLDRRVQVVRDAGRARDLRTAWLLAAQKMAELELDPAVWTGTGGSAGGDFSELGADGARFQWESLVVRQPIETNDPLDPRQKPKEVFRLTLRVAAEGLEEPLLLEAQFPVEEIPKAGEGAPPPGQQPSPPGEEPKK